MNPSAPVSGPGSLEAATVQLNDGIWMPTFGLGVYRSNPGKETYDAVKDALQLGYRLVDSAALYRNEQSVGKAVHESGIPREDIWVTTKLWDSDHGYDKTIQACTESLRKLSMDYVDLYLIHSPNTGKIVETWDAMLELKRRGLARSVGVSNFDVAHIKALCSAGRPLPAVNQIEMHPLIYREREHLVSYCKENGILVQAYGSIFSGQMDKLRQPAVAGPAAARPGKTEAQVLLRWALQMGFAIIPKSVNRPRIQGNMDVFDFELTQAEMDALSAMRGQLGAYWNPLRARVDLGRTDRGGGVA